MVELKVAIKTVSDGGQVLKQHIRDVQQFNAAIQNGNRALYQIMAGAAAWLSTATVRAALQQAQESAQTLARLQVALGGVAVRNSRNWLVRESSSPNR